MKTSLTLLLLASSTTLLALPTSIPPPPPPPISVIKAAPAFEVAPTFEAGPKFLAVVPPPEDVCRNSRLFPTCWIRMWKSKPAPAPEPASEPALASEAVAKATVPPPEDVCRKSKLFPKCWLHTGKPKAAEQPASEERSAEEASEIVARDLLDDRCKKNAYGSLECMLFLMTSGYKQKPSSGMKGKPLPKPNSKSE